MPIYVAAIIGGLAALVITILICALILPKSKEGQFTGFMKFIRDYFLMKYLVLEAVLRFFFILNTVGCITIGFFLLFSRLPGYNYMSGYTSTGGGSAALIGLAYIVFGPFVVRITYEVFMLAIMTLKNIMEINAKMDGDTKGVTSAFDIPMPQSNPAPVPVVPVVPDMTNYNANVSDANIEVGNDVNTFGEGEGTPIVPPDNKICPSCGKLIHVDSKFCTGCGYKL